MKKLLSLGSTVKRLKETSGPDVEEGWEKELCLALLKVEFYSNSWHLTEARFSQIKEVSTC